MRERESIPCRAGKPAAALALANPCHAPQSQYILEERDPSRSDVYVMALQQRVARLWFSPAMQLGSINDADE